MRRVQLRGACCRLGVLPMLQFTTSFTYFMMAERRRKLGARPYCVHVHTEGARQQRVGWGERVRWRMKEGPRGEANEGVDGWRGEEKGVECDKGREREKDRVSEGGWGEGEAMVRGSARGDMRREDAEGEGKGRSRWLR